MNGRPSPLDELLSVLERKSSKNENGDANSNSRQFQSLLHSGNEDPLLDSALAMVGFTSATVQQTLSTISGKTLITVLASSIASASKLYFGRLESAVLSNNASTSSCFLGTSISHHELSLDDDYMCCGAPFSTSRAREIMEEALSFLKGSKLEDQSIVDLVEVLVKLYSTMSAYKSRLVGSCLLYEREKEQEETLALSFLDDLINFSLEKKAGIYNQFNPSIRLLLWRLQSGLLVQDLSALLETIAERPLMSLKNEFRRRQGWYNLIIAMAFGPDVFREGRQTLNAWLLASGAPFVWELKVELGACIWDMLQHPSSWGVSVDVGISLPPLSAFYCGTLHSIAMMLTRPPSWGGLRELGNLLEDKAAQDAGHSALHQNAEGPLRGLRGMETADRDMAHLDSLWMLSMDFPAWILFASLSLFQRPIGSCGGHSNSVGPGDSDNQSDPNGQEYAAWLSHQETAAQYIAWHFSPNDEKLRGLVVQMLRRVVQGWLNIKDEEILLGPAVKRRRLTTMHTKGINPACEKQMLVEEEVSVPEDMHKEARRKVTSDHPNLLKDVAMSVQKWLLSFQDSCSLLDDYSQGRTSGIRAIESMQQAKRRLVLSDVAGEVTTMRDSQQSEAMCTYKSFSFLDDLPLVALSCSPFLHKNAIVHLILHSVMVGSRFLSSRKDGYQEGRKGLAFKEPSHRTEDFRDACQEPFCLNFSCHASASKASGLARLFRFLETLDLLEFSSFVNGCHGLQWLDSFKEAVARQLQLCMRSWSQQADSTYCLTVLDDLQQRASSWAARTGLKSKTLKAFEQALQGLDILIASSVVDDTFLSA
ncbi:hypothetical protein GOP47_0000827 [Adiantum capillus-veneris]|uniref:Uncharacterized protein n=1 Tax=Adiantum capillus-veneris TaxID=13818 RepID=A0A9D4VE93_ADICA|nr:hypothetical protein GOP47_0000827 [Adiantum capillus-veneris]